MVPSSPFVGPPLSATKIKSVSSKIFYFSNAFVIFPIASSIILAMAATHLRLELVISGNLSKYSYGASNGQWTF